MPGVRVGLREDGSGRQQQGEDDRDGRSRHGLLRFPHFASGLAAGFYGRPGRTTLGSGESVVRTVRTGPLAFTVEFESEEELAAEARTNLSAGGLRLPTMERLAIFSRLALVLRLAGGGEATASATVVAPLPDGVALAVDGDTAALVEALRTRPQAPGDAGLEEAVEEAEDEGQGAPRGNVWDRLRSISRMEKLLLAPKADRVERAILAQDSDPQVLYSLLKNPRLTADEVIRIAKSPFLTFQTAEAIMKSTQWLSNLEVRVALVHNAKTPPAFAMRLLHTLPESEVRTISHGAATSMALKSRRAEEAPGLHVAARSRARTRVRSPRSVAESAANRE